MTLLHILAGSERGGCERNCLVACRELLSVNHELLVLGRPGTMAAELAASGSRLTHLGLRSPSGFASINLVREYVSQRPPCAVILWHGMVALPQLLFALRQHRVPIVVHGGNPAYSLPRWIDWKFKLLSWLLPAPGWPTYACCSRFVAESFESSAYLRRFPRVVIWNGVQSVDETGVHQPRSVGREGSFTIGMVARLDAIKDHATLLRAFAEILRQRPKARLELAGDGDLRQVLEAQATELGIRKSVQFLGMVENVNQVIRSWDLFVYATTEREGMGNAVAEAMMVGLPSVATEVAPIREVAGTPPVIRLTPPGDAVALAQVIIDLIDNIDERSRLGREARGRALQHFSSAEFARRYADLLFPEGCK